MATTLALTTDLSVEECLSRLHESLSPVRPFRWAMPSTETYFGKVRGDMFQVFVVGPGDMRKNSFTPIFYGSLRASPEGARISGSISVHTFVSVFLTAWYVGVLAFLGAIWWHLLTSGSDLGSAVGMLFIAFLAFVSANAVAVPWLIFSFGRRLNREKEGTLKRFVVATLEAREVASAEGR
ncbi:MAG: hypothetical protein KJ000_27820 [Pirellulaceae bacterium]|nr:hypothetical protein [Pirellulaceae bacterium]